MAERRSVKMGGCAPSFALICVLACFDVGEMYESMQGNPSRKNENENRAAGKRRATFSCACWMYPRSVAGGLCIQQVVVAASPGNQLCLRNDPIGVRQWGSRMGSRAGCPPVCRS